MHLLFGIFSPHSSRPDSPICLQEENPPYSLSELALRFQLPCLSPPPPCQTHAVTQSHIIMASFIRANSRPSGFLEAVYFRGFYPWREHMDHLLCRISLTPLFISAASFGSKGKCMCQCVGESHPLSSGHLAFECWEMVCFTSVFQKHSLIGT